MLAGPNLEVLIFRKMLKVRDWDLLTIVAWLISNELSWTNYSVADSFDS